MKRWYTQNQEKIEFVPLKPKISNEGYYESILWKRIKKIFNKRNYK